MLISECECICVSTLLVCLLTNESVFPCVSLLICTIYLILAHIHTLACVFIVTQLQPSGTVALIGVLQGGAAVAAASVVGMAACGLCIKQHRGKYYEFRVL